MKTHHQSDEDCASLIKAIQFLAKCYESNQCGQGSAQEYEKKVLAWLHKRSYNWLACWEMLPDRIKEKPMLLVYFLSRKAAAQKSEFTNHMHACTSR